MGVVYFDTECYLILLVPSLYVLFKSFLRSVGQLNGVV